MKYSIVALISLLTLFEPLLANDCQEIKRKLDKIRRRQATLKSLEIKNNNAYKKTKSPLKKVKISSNLIIIKNKKDKLILLKEDFKQKSLHCNFIERY